MKFNISYSELIRKIEVILIIVYITVALIFQQKLFNEIMSNALYLYGIGLVIILLGFLGINYKFILKENKTVTVYVVVLLLFIFINSVFVRKEFLIGAIFSIIVSVIIGKILNKIESPSFILLVPFWFLSTYILFSLISDPNPNNVFVNSRNYISFYLIFTVSPYYYLKLKNNINPSFFPAIVTFSFAIYSSGRSGIISSTLIILALFWSRIRLSRKQKILSLISIGIIVLFTVYLYLLNNAKDVYELERYRNFSGFFQESGRASIIAAYYKELNWMTFLFGIEPEIVLKSASFNTKHFHSSLLLLFSSVGIAGLLFLSYFVYKLISFYKHNMPVFLLFLAIILRISTDSGALFAYFDFAIWMFLFYNPSKEIKDI